MKLKLQKDLEELKALKKELASLREKDDERRYRKLASRLKKEKLQSLRAEEQKKLLLKLK